jgi:nitrogen fixation-related uncharacterized protein
MRVLLVVVIVLAAVAFFGYAWATGNPQHIHV